MWDMGGRGMGRNGGAGGRASEPVLLFFELTAESENPEDAMDPLQPPGLAERAWGL